MGLGGNDPLLQQAPALTQRPEHAQGLDHFSVVQRAVHIDRRLHAQAIGFAQPRARRQFAPQRQADQHQGEHQCQHAEPGVKDERHQQEDRQPGCIEQGDQALPGNQLAQRCQVGEHLRRVGVVLAQAASEGGVENPLAQGFVQPRAHANHHLAAHPLDQGAEHEQSQGDQGEHEQGGFVATGEYPVVHLHHVERRHQHQQVDHATE
ncbi:hypothetical protein D3C84_714390 [compost metagenome]